MNSRFLFAHKDLVDDVLSESERQLQFQELIRDARDGQSEAISFLRKLVTFDSEAAFSWLHSAGTKSQYLSLEIIESLPNDLAFRLLWESATSPQPLIPYDFRGLMFEAIIRGVEQGRFTLSAVDLMHAKRLARADAWRFRSDDEKLALPTDGIDHLFEFPVTLEAKLAILRTAADEGVRRQLSLLCRRFLRAVGDLQSQTLFLKGLRNREVEAQIEADVGCRLIEGTDYLMPWDHVLTCGLTMAELSRLILFSDDLQTPSPAPRMALLATHRACFKTSGRSIIGLKAGTFHVEHGTLAAPSYFYMGRDAALGKGCVIDNIGGAVVLNGAFLGGGFMPILIHTHKHLRKAGESAIKERQLIRPGIFVALAGHRLPMSSPGILEMTDAIDGELPAPGMTCWPVDPEFSISHRRIQL